MEKPKAHVSQKKKDTVTKIVKLLQEFPIVGVLNLENLPASQGQTIRARLRKDVTFAIARKTLLIRAIEQAKSSKPGVEKLLEKFGTMPALMFTKENPFKLFKMIKQSKSPAYAKPGQKAPYDLSIKAGPTPFTPGPVISELASIGIKTKVDQGKLTVVADTIVCHEGAVISDKVASFLAKLNIMPMEIGLDLLAVYEKGDILTRSVLDVDEKLYLNNITQAARWAFNLSVEACYITNDNRETIIQKAYRDSKALAISQNIMADAVVGELLAKAQSQAQQVATDANYT